MNGCAPGLALIERLKATQKWVIIRYIYAVSSNHYYQGEQIK